ncbi:MAG TPA: hypothetical protein VGD62_00900, partial [Acidobacteriaceae bacterium]
MPSLLHPGVYVQEVPSTVKPISGVSTSTAAFIGVADQGPIPGTLLGNGEMAEPVKVTSFTDYQRNFGGFRTDSFLTYAAQAFFQNGGSSLYIVRIAVIAPPGSPPTGPCSPPDFAGATTALKAFTGPASFPISITALNEGKWGNR